MDAVITRAASIFYYDAYRDGHDTTIIKDLSGTSSISSNKLLVSNTDLCTFAAVNNQNVEFLMSIPVAPVAAQSKVFGVQGPAQANLGAMVFDITGAVFSAKVYTADGTAVLFSQPITWLSAWTATQVRYKILVTERNVIFVINDNIVAQFGNDSGTVFGKFAHNPMPMRVTNNNVDNLLISSISAY